MKYLVIIMSLFVMAATFPAAAAADDWDEYLAYSARYYYLDQQEFNSITCTIESSTLTNLISQLKEQLKPIEDHIELAANLESFSMQYSTGKGFDVTRPEFDVKLTSEEGLPDPGRVRNGIGMIKSGVDQMIDGLIMEMQGILGGLVSPRREDYDEMAAKQADERFTATYQRDGNAVTETFSGTTLDISEHNDSVDIHILGNFQKAGKDNDKLILKDVTITMLQTAGKAETVISVTYQKVGPVLFPRKITTKGTQEFQSMRQEGQTEIAFTNCKAD